MSNLIETIRLQMFLNTKVKADKKLVISEGQNIQQHQSRGWVDMVRFYLMTLSLRQLVLSSSN